MGKAHAAGSDRREMRCAGCGRGGRKDGQLRTESRNCSRWQALELGRVRCQSDARRRECVCELDAGG